MIALTLPPYSVVIVAIVLIIALHWLRKPGRGGAVGRRIRQSDHWAWRDAITERQQMIEELTKRQRAKPCLARADQIAELRNELTEIQALEPNQ